MPKEPPTITSVIKKYFEKHLNKDITQEEMATHVLKKIPDARDPWRTVRKLYGEGWLIQVSKGVYRRDPKFKGINNTAPFSEKVKQKIFERDNYRCVICGNGKHNSYEIHADHIQPQAKGGKSTLENGQTLCSEHNMLKKRYGTTDFLDKYCDKMIERAENFQDNKIIQMFKEIKEVIKKYLSSS